MVWTDIGGSQKSNVVETMAKTAPGLALLGSGIFASSQYLPKLGELSEVISLRVIWSRSEVCLFHKMATLFIEVGKVVLVFSELKGAGADGRDSINVLLFVCGIRMVQRRRCCLLGHMHPTLRPSGVKKV